MKKFDTTSIVLMEGGNWIVFWLLGPNMMQVEFEMSCLSVIAKNINNAGGKEE